VERCWRAIPEHFKSVELDEFVLMPNHLHGILWFMDDREAVKRPALGSVLGSFKSAVTREINAGMGVRGALVWQRNYFEHIIRDDDSLESIRDYIRENPARWQHDDENDAGDGTDDVQRWLDRMIAERRGEALPRPAHVKPKPSISEGRGMPRPYRDYQ